MYKPLMLKIFFPHSATEQVNVSQELQARPCSLRKYQIQSLHPESHSSSILLHSPIHISLLSPPIFPAVILSCFQSMSKWPLYFSVITLSPNYILDFHSEAKKQTVE